MFVTGCQRSGTTAFAEYINQHPEVLVGVERYGRVPATGITPDHFSFERILDYGAEDSLMPREYYVDLLSRKDPERLKWIGDKFPGYAKWLKPLSENNPGARFIILYRPIEEVAESWEARSNNPEDPWLGGKNGFELGVSMWNNIQDKTRNFVQSGLGAGVLIVSYHDFFGRNEACVPLISNFLGIEFDAGVREAWRRMSAEFEQSRRAKKPLTREQEAYIEEKKDVAAEGWVLSRMEEQWRSQAARERRRDEWTRALQTNPRELMSVLLEVDTKAEEQTSRALLLEQRVRHLERENRRLKLQGQSSRSRKLLGYLKYLRTRVSTKE